MGNYFATVRQVATYGNQPLVPVGQKAILGNDRFACRAGEMMLYDNISNLTIDAAGIAAAGQAFWVIGLGKTKGGRASSIQIIGTKEFKPCIDQVRVDYTRPRCEIAPEYAIEIGCVECYSSYPLAIYARSPLTKFYYGGEGEIEFFTTYATSCPADCEPDCADQTVTEYEVACGLMRNFKRQIGKVNVAHTQFDNSTMNYLPFVTVAVEAGRSVFKACLAPATPGCTQCTETPGIDDIVFTFASGDVVTVDLTRYINNDNILVEDRDEIQVEIEEAIAPFNSSVIIVGGNGCCPMEIKAAGCITAMVINLTAGGTATVCEEDPFIPIEQDADCKDCLNTTPVPRTAAALLLVWMKDVGEYCTNNLPAGAVNFEDTRAEVTDIQFQGPNWTQNHHSWYILRHWREGIGAGYHTQIEAMRRQHPAEGTWRHEGGHKFGHYQNAEMNNHRKYTVLDAYDCNGVYCSINIGILRKHAEWHANSVEKGNEESFTIDIPWADTVTHDAAKTIVDAWVATGNCNTNGEGCYTECGIDYTTDVDCDCTNEGTVNDSAVTAQDLTAGVLTLTLETDISVTCAGVDLTLTDSGGQKVVIPVANIVTLTATTLTTDAGAAAILDTAGFSAAGVLTTTIQLVEC